MTTNGRLRLHLRVTHAPAPTDPGEEFGLQSKAGDLDPGTEEPDGERQLHTEVAVIGDRTAAPDFRGDHVHGRPGGRFLYIGLRPRTGEGAWIRRIKVPLGSIGWSDVDGGVLMAQVDGRAAATVEVAWRPF